MKTTGRRPMAKNKYPPPAATRSFGKHVMYLCNGISLDEAIVIAEDTLGVTEDREHKGTWQIIGHFYEEKVKRNHTRTVLGEALDMCDEFGAVLLVPKMLHLCQTVNFLEAVLATDVPVIGCDLNGAERVPMRLLYAQSIAHRAKVSVSVRKKHAELKRKGVKLGSPSLDQTRSLAWRASKRKAVERAEKILPIIQRIEDEGATTLVEIANQLNKENVPTARGGRWHPSAVRLLMRRRK